MKNESSNEIEIEPIEIFSLMRKNIYNYHRDKNSINIDKTYIILRKSLIALLNKISNQMNFKTRTFYQAVNYLDIIFSKQKNITHNYYLLSAGCLMISSKFCENVPLKPTFQRFIKFANEEIKNNEFKITKEDLFLYEIIICKILDYKLNYFNIYDFNFFFFGNGILKFEHLKDINNFVEISNEAKRNILIKIYERSKYYLNNIINNLICIKYSSLLISICIMEKSIDYVLIKEFNREDSFNKDEIKRKNKKYFWEIMKNFYKIEYESLEDYQYLKLDCEKYKIFEDNYSDNKKKEFTLNNDINSVVKSVNDLNANMELPKEINKTLKISNDESIRNKKYNKNNKQLLYKKVNITCYENKKDLIENSKWKQRKNSLDNKIKDKNYIVDNNNSNNNTNPKRTYYEFYQNKKNLHRNYKSNYKDNYFLKKTNTSNSPFKDFVNKNINNIKRIESPNSNSNSFYEKKEINIYTKPYKKKIIVNHEKIQSKNNNITSNNTNNINININISNRILYETISKSKHRNNSSRKIIISKYIDNDNGNELDIKERKNKYKSKSKINEIKFGNNFNSSPIYKRNISKVKYNISFKKNHFNDKSYNNMNLQTFHNKIKDNYKKINNEINQLYINDININNIPNSGLTSRNSFQFPKSDFKFTDSFLNIQMNYYNNTNRKNNSNNKSYNKKKETTFKNNNNDNDFFNYNNNKPNDNLTNKNSSKSKFVSNNYNKFQNNINNNLNITWIPTIR